MRKTVIIAFCVLALSWGLCAKETIKVGVVLPMTGNMAQVGEMGQMGAQLRIRELESASHFNYQLIFEDDGFVFSRTAAAVKKLRDIDHADVIITMWGYGSDIALPYLADKPGVIHLNVDRWADGRGNNDFVVGASLDDHVKMLIDLIKKKGMKRVVFVGTAEQGTENLRRKIADVFSQHGITLVDSTMFSTEVMDLRTWVLKTKEQNPELIIECLQMPTVQVLLKQMHDLGIQIPVGHTTQGVFEVDAALKENSWLIYPTAPTTTWARHFESEYKKKSIYPAPQFYNTLSLLVEACEHSDGKKKPTTTEIISSMKSLGSYEGSTGTLNFVAPNKYEAPVTYYIFKSGKPVEATLEEVIKTTK